PLKRPAGFAGRPLTPRCDSDSARSYVGRSDEAALATPFKRPAGFAGRPLTPRCDSDSARSYVSGTDEHRARLRRLDDAGWAGSPSGRDRERQVPDSLPSLEVGGRIDRSVVTEVEQRHRVHLEMQMGGCTFCVAGVPHETDHLTRTHACAVPRADREHRSIGDREQRLAELAEEVVAVVVADIGPIGPVAVDVRRHSVDGEPV